MRVQQDVVWVLKREHVRASLKMNVVAPVLDPLLKQDRAEWQSVSSNHILTMLKQRSIISIE